MSLKKTVGYQPYLANPASHPDQPAQRTFIPADPVRHFFHSHKESALAGQKDLSDTNQPH